MPDENQEIIDVIKKTIQGLPKLQDTRGILALHTLIKEIRHYFDGDRQNIHIFLLIYSTFFPGNRFSLKIKRGNYEKDDQYDRPYAINDSSRSSR